MGCGELNAQFIGAAARMRVGVRVGVGAFGGGVGAHLASINFELRVWASWQRGELLVAARMPIVGVGRDALFALLGKQYTQEEKVETKPKYGQAELNSWRKDWK